MPARKRQSTKKPSGAPPSATVPGSTLTYFQHTITPMDVARRYSRRVKPTELIRRVQTCPTVAYCVYTNSMVLAHNAPRVVKRGKARTPGTMPDVMQRRITDLKTLRCVRDSKRVGGKSAEYAIAAGDDIYEVTDHPFIDLYARPNRRETSINFWGAEFTARQATGNAYSMIQRDGKGLPVELWHCFSQYTNPTLSQDGFIDGYQYWVPGDERIVFAPEDIFHTIWMQSGLYAWDGMGWVETVVSDIDSLLSINAQEQASYENNCQPCGILTMSEDLAPDQVKQQEAAINSKHRGPSNVGKIMVVQGATSFSPLGWSPREMQSGATVQAHERRIRNAGGIPESFANLSQSNLAGAISGNSQYAGVLIQPQLVNNAEMLTRFLLDQYGLDEGDYWVTYPNIIEANADELANNAKMKYESGGMTLNEYRAELNLDPIKDERGNLTYQENTARAASVFGPTPSQPVGAGGGDAPTERVQQAPIRSLPAPNKVDAPASDSGKSISLPVVGATPATVPATKDADLEDTETTPPPTDMLSAVRGWLEESQASGVYDPDKLSAAIADPIKDIFQTGGIAGLNDLATHGIDVGNLPAVASGAVNASFDVLPKPAIDFLNGYTIRLSQAIAADKQDQLNSAISAGISQGMNTQDATAAVMESLGDRTQDQAEMIARTETTRAYVEGSRTAWHSVGVQAKQILLAPDACDICKAVQAMYPDPIPLEQPYFTQGQSIALPNGKSFSFNYGDIQGPPFHPGDRCSLRPVLEIQP